jgi:chromosome segregation protein
MRLKHLKLAGFKSFVDPTIIPFTHSLSAVVGPNGCGKSNIIDAVRWVLGESSAKNLRGDDMSDVIFNGSNARKPVSVASVELLFDNSDGRAQGPWEKFSEIAIKRQVSRQGQSDYFVNGQKCRRRDISDLLSGTGLGPRSYSIIEQGTISRLVESKPAELRGFIEDAAGISKYKERKRDTLNRIRNSRENLSRLNDLNNELTSQIQSLETQATQAQEYTSLKEQERALNIDIVVARWKSFNTQLVHTQVGLDEASQQLIMVQQRLMELTTSENTQKNSLKSTQYQLDQVSNVFHENQESITRLTLNIEHLVQTSQQRQHQLEQLALKQESLNTQLTQANEQLYDNKQALSLAKVDIAPVVASRDALKKSQLTNDQLLESIEAQLFTVSHEKQQAIGESQLYKQQIDGLTNQQVKTNSQIELLNVKRVDLAKQQHKLNPVTRSDQFRQAQQKLQQIQLDVDNVNELAISSQKHHTQLLADLNTTEQHVAILSQERKGILAQIDNLSAIDDTILMARFDEASQLWKNITVVPQWQKAVEVLLNPVLCGFIVPGVKVDESLSSHCQLWPSVESIAIGTELNTLSLLQFVRGKTPASNDILSTILADVLCAETSEQALAQLPFLTPNQRVVTPSGDVYTSYGYWHHKENIDSKSGLVTLNELAINLNHDITLRIGSADKLRILILEQDKVVEQTNDEQRQCIIIFQSHIEVVNNTKQQWLLEQQQWEHVSSQIDDVSSQVEELTRHDVIDSDAINTLKKSLVVIKDNMSFGDNRFELLKQEKSVEKQVSKQLQKKLDLALSQVHQSELAIQKLEMQQQSDTKQVTQLTDDLQSICSQFSAIDLLFNESVLPLQDKKSTLTQLKVTKNKVTDDKNELTNKLQQLNELQIDQTNRLQTASNDKNSQQKLVEQLHVKRETLKVKLQSQEQNIALNARELAQLADTMVESADIKHWPQALDRVRHKLANMGAINLTAIEQYNEQKQRLDELTNQCEDLEEGLQTLERAIKKIDRQSREKFKQTFDSVNIDFQRLFPKVFGGGSAQLTLTDSDLLLAGVSIMAQPPGKKNSTIHLLSGGEKALTALSLVFAIFQLNPAPFCMLDEVDAPLDDANVDRYCNLVNEMSEKVQFIYITHNKVSMEMATQLTGVTMQEAGVSRIVAVDVDAAVSMAQQ